MASRRMPRLKVVVSDVQTVSNSSLQRPSLFLFDRVRDYLVADHLGGIGGPVTTGAADPANGSGRGDPEQVGQDGGGKASTQVQERASPSGHGRDAEASEPLAEMRGPERPPGRQAGEEPGCRRW